MFERFAEDMRRAVLVAAEEASRRRGDLRLGTEHLLMGVVATGEPVSMEFGLSVDRIRAAQEARDARALRAVGIEADLDVIPRRPPRRSRHWLWPRSHLPFTVAAKRSLERSLHICLAEHHRAITTTHLMAALVVGEPRDPAVRALRDLGIDPSEIDEAIRRGWGQATA
jgi:ATP-dependent Clp protease ATP-binding subunit ClpA